MYSVYKENLIKSFSFNNENWSVANPIFCKVKSFIFECHVGSINPDLRVLGKGAHEVVVIDDHAIGLITT